MSFRARHPILGSFIRPLLALIPLLGFFMLFALPRIPETNASRRGSEARALMRQLGRSLEQSRSSSGVYPAALPFDVALEPSSSFSTEFGKMADPVAIDPFRPRDRIPLVYGTNGKRWVLISMGPDEVHDLPPRQFLDGGITPVVLTNLTYDPTNGTFSPGDIFRASKAEKP